MYIQPHMCIKSIKSDEKLKIKTRHVKQYGVRKGRRSGQVKKKKKKKKKKHCI